MTNIHQGLSVHRYKPISLDGPSGWDSARVALRGQKYCPWWITFLDPSTGDVFDYAKPCGSLTHRPCAERQVMNRLIHVARCFAQYDFIWVTHAIYEDALPTRMRVRRYQLARKLGTPIHGYWVQRTNGTFYYFATAALPGDLPPETGAWESSEVAYNIARTVMFLPGLGSPAGTKPTNFSSGWRRPRRSTESRGLIRLSHREAMGRQVVEAAAFRLRVAPPPKHWRSPAWSKPPGVDIDCWIRTVQDAALEVEPETFC